MPTLPSSGTPHSDDEPHQDRELAESFGADAGRYDRARPDYPQALVDRVVAESPGTDVLDVGVGTGIAARQFQAAGCRVLGVDVDARMADVARASGVDAEVAPFETWDPAGRTFDAVVSAQSWHWVDAVAGAAGAARVLRPGGRLAVFWNVFMPAPDLREAFADVHRRVLPDAPLNPWALGPLDAYEPLSTKAADGMRQAAAFDPPEQWRFDWQRAYTRAQWLDQLPTHGGTGRLPPATLADLLSGIGTVIDTFGGGFTMGYATVVVTAARTDSA
ncbi:class I SAM-dependent methyltransferase [Streptomyces flavofungini]|uniref:Class I SAM-dependent methyltransferase n=1 Tax=Streptomyces flavofungini TaxID=68200 RepID=A0ABS0X9C4_9ACTN|nr:class I SAM-dependent methyltransferase [Streptomyces flavofungini]MBJ3809805.1 class I SAM-dependent methyltransferase [Streptomyces flavofungini]GHC80843.1 methyltransferase type 11 [Streptomyces flavofungini]